MVEEKLGGGSGEDTAFMRLGGVNNIHTGGEPGGHWEHWELKNPLQVNDVRGRALGAEEPPPS